MQALHMFIYQWGKRKGRREGALIGTDWVCSSLVASPDTSRGMVATPSGLSLNSTPPCLLLQ